MGVQRALTAVMQLKRSQGNYDPQKEIESLLRARGQVVTGALQRLGFVHFARLVFLGSGDNRQFAIITTYDFDFEDYINVFIDDLGPMFDAMLQHIEGAPPTPVRQHRNEFVEYVRRVDVTNPDIMKNSAETQADAIKPGMNFAIFYSAYPDLTVQQIWKLQGDAYV